MEIINTKVFGIEDSLIRSGYPLKTNIGLFKYEGVDEFNKMLVRGEKLGSAPNGSGHDKFLRGIVVQADIIAPRYFWQEWDTYHFCESISSQSTQHCAKKFNLRKMANQYVDPIMLSMLEKYIEAYNKEPTIQHFLKVKSNWLEGIELGRGISTNYNTLKTMHSQREHHQLPEWNVVFEDWLHDLPYVKELGVI